MRRIVITAAASDFGTALLERMCESGTKDIEWIFATYHSSSAGIDEVVKKYPALSDKLILEAVDMQDVEAIGRMCAKIKEKGTPTDIVHLPAPKAEPMQFRKLSWDTFKDQMEISFRSAVLILKELLPTMAKEKEGRVLLVSSYYGTEEYTPSFLTPYVCAKAALLALMRSLSKEYEDKNIKINAIAPDIANTKFLDEMPDIMKEAAAKQSGRGELLDAKEVADAMMKYIDPDLKENGKAVIVR